MINNIQNARMFKMLYTSAISGNLDEDLLFKMCHLSDKKIYLPYNYFKRYFDTEILTNYLLTHEFDTDYEYKEILTNCKAMIESIESTYITNVIREVFSREIEETFKILGMDYTREKSVSYKNVLEDIQEQIKMLDSERDKLRVYDIEQGGLEYSRYPNKQNVFRDSLYKIYYNEDYYYEEEEEEGEEQNKKNNLELIEYDSDSDSSCCSSECSTSTYDYFDNGYDSYGSHGSHDDYSEYSDYSVYDLCADFNKLDI